MHNLIKSKLDEWQNDEYSEYLPKKEGKLQAVCFESKSPIDSHYNIIKIFNMTKWLNCEGFDISIHTYNQKTGDYKDNQFSFQYSDIEGFLYCLKELNYFQ